MIKERVTIKTEDLDKLGQPVVTYTTGEFGFVKEYNQNTILYVVFKELKRYAIDGISFSDILC